MTKSPSWRGGASAADVASAAANRADVRNAMRIPFVCRVRLQASRKLGPERPESIKPLVTTPPAVIGRRHDFRQEFRLDVHKAEHRFGNGRDLARVGVEQYILQAPLLLWIVGQRPDALEQCTP